MATLWGDVVGTTGALSGHQKGEAQTLIGTDNQDNTIFGDAYSIVDFARGGNDTLIGGNSTGTGVVITNQLYGDAYQMTGHARGGADTLCLLLECDPPVEGDHFCSSGAGNCTPFLSIFSGGGPFLFARTVP
jgi:hypothetical protein